MQGPCLKCGGDHRTGACPDKADPKLGDKRGGGAPFNGLVLMTEDLDEARAEELRNTPKWVSR